MKPLEQIKLEVLHLSGKETYLKKKEFTDLVTVLREDETILDIVTCNITKPSIMAGILVTTSQRILFLSHSVFSQLKINEFQYIKVLKINRTNGILFTKIGFKHDDNEIEFDYIQNKFAQNTAQILELNIQKSKQFIIEEELTQELDITLNPLEKIQFKKFLSEQGGMTITEVENYLTVTSEDEVNEIIKEFKKIKKVDILKKLPEDNSKFTTATPLNKPIVQVVKVVDDNSNLPTCPKCKSKQVSFGKQGFGVGKAFVGAVLTGGIGLLAGGINKNKINLTCLSCGHHWSK